MNKFTNLFQTDYKTNYTEENLPEENDKFVSQYSTNNSDMIISGKTRPKNMKYKSRLVTK